MNRKNFIIITTAALITASALNGEIVSSNISTSAGDLSIQNISAGSTVYSRIGLKGADRFTDEQGRPQLPVRIIRFALPYNAVIKGFSANARRSEIIHLSQQAAPAQPPVPLNGGAAPAWIPPSGSAYDGKDFYPQDFARIVRISALSEYKIVEIEAHPARYNPALGQLSLALDLDVSLEYVTDSKKQIAVSRRSALAQNALLSAVRAAVANKQNLSPAARTDAGQQQNASYSPAATGKAVDFVIITSENLRESFRPLADWRTRTGMVTEIRTTEWIGQNFSGADLQEKIRLFIQACWSQWGTAFVLLGGAHPVVPVRCVPWTAWPEYIPDLRVPTDLYYSDIADTCYGQDAHQYNFNYNRNDQYGEVEGSADRIDLQPDVFLGRAPVETPAQAAAFTAKVLAYEQNPPPGFGSSFLMMADGIFAPLTEMVNDLPLAPAAPWVDPVEQYTPVSGSGWQGDEALNAGAALARLNEGPNFIYHIDHGGIYSLATAVGSGGGWLYRTEAQSLHNAARPSIVVTPACSPNAFDNECFSKSLINNPHGGAVAFIGNTRVGFTNQAAQCQAFFNAVYGDKALRLGEAFNRLIGSGGNDYQRLAMNLLGDPSLQVWSAEPETLMVTHNAGQSAQIKKIVVAVSARSTGGAALVCLYKDGDIQKTAQTNLPGAVSFAVAPQTSGYLHITVTGRNLRPYHDSCLVAPVAAPPARIASLLCFDDSTGKYDASSGNHDLTANPGEAVMLYPAIAVSPESSLEQLTINLINGIANDAANSTVKFTHLLPGSMVQCDTLAGNGFLVKVSPDARPGNVRLTFSFSAVIAQEPPRRWVQTFDIPVLADSLVYQMHRIEIRKYDHHHTAPAVSAAPSVWKRIAVLDSITVSNLGAGASGNVTVRLRSHDPAAMVIDSVVCLGVIKALSTSTGSAGLSLGIRSGRPAGSISASIAICGQNGRVAIHPLILADSVPAPTGVLAGTDQGIVRISWNAPVQAQYKGFQVYRAALDQECFEKINRSLIEGSSAYVDETAAPNCSYVYAVSGVDSFGNQSGLSAARDTVRAPADLKPGFPVPMGTGGRGNRIWGSPAAGDVNGDGYSEIVMGCDDGKIYAVDHAGGSLPGWPVNLGYQIDNSTPALADIDQDGLPEIILGSGAWYTACGDGLVHAFNGDGSEALGWPQPVVGDAFASCAAADIDGNGLPEVIAATTAGLIYVWSGDGAALPGWPAATGGRIAASPSIGNLDDDPCPEIVVNANCSGVLRLFVLKADGQAVAGWPRDLQQGASYTLSAPGLADIDGDSALEIIQATEPDPAWGFSCVFCLNADGTQPQGWPVYIASSARTLASPAFGDLNGDGKTDVVICSGDGNVHAFSRQGMSGKLWETQGTSNGRTNPVIADIDGDLAPEIVLTSEDGWLRALNGADGTQAGGFPLRTESSWSAPAIADIDRDGMLDLVASGWGSHKLFAWSLGAAGNGSRMWNTYQGNNQRTGCYIPEIPAARQAVQSSTVAAAAPRTKLLQNFPNPVADRTMIRYQLAAPGPVAVKLYNITGQLVINLFSGLQPAGSHELTWDRCDGQGRKVSSGVYLYRLETNETCIAKRMTVIK